MADINHCPVCRFPRFDITDELDRGNLIEIDCPRCGRFTIGKMASYRLATEPKPDHALSAWIRHRELHQAEMPTLRQESLGQIRQWLPSFSIAERSIELLKALAVLSRRPGALYSGNLIVDPPLAWAENEDELKFHLEALSQRRMISFEQTDMEGSYHATLTADGWSEVEHGPAAILPRAFVAMSFSNEMLAAWTDGLKPGIESAGYTAHRVDSEPHVQRIDQKIVADIRTSRFVVVDVTEQKQGAYFEAGLALGFGKTVIWTVREDDLKNVHFDTRQYAHIVWNDPAHLKETLRDVIVAVLGVGPRKPI